MESVHPLALGIAIAEAEEGHVGGPTPLSSVHVTEEEVKGSNKDRVIDISSSSSSSVSSGEIHRIIKGLLQRDCKKEL